MRDKPHPGKASQYTEAIRRRIVQIALKDPKLFGYLRNDWNLRLLARHLTRNASVEISFQHLQRILHEAGIVYKRPKATITSPDPDYELKARRVNGYKRIAPALTKKGYS